MSLWHLRSSQRRREIAIRIRRSARRPTDVRNLFLGQSSSALVVAGIAIGLPLRDRQHGLRLYSALLFGVHPADLPTISSVIAPPSLAALAAAHIPGSRRATQVDLAPALRAE